MIRALAVAALASGCFSESPRPACGPARKLEVVNDSSADVGPWLSEDRRELMFSSSRAGSLDLYRATRGDFDVSFGVPVQMTGDVNTAMDEENPFVMRDGRTVWFDSQRHSSTYRQIYVAARPDRNSSELTLVREATELGEGRHPSLTADGLTIYFEAYDTIYTEIYTASRGSTSDLFSARRRVQEIEVENIQATPSITPDGQTLLFATAAPNGTQRLLRAERGSDGVFLTPDPVAEVGPDTGHNDAEPYMMPDGKTILFASDRAPSGTADKDIFITCE